MSSDRLDERDPRKPAEPVFQARPPEVAGLDARLNRRTLLARAGLFAAGAPLVGGLLAACGSSSSTTGSGATNTATSAASSATNSGSSGGAEATATSAASSTTASTGASPSASPGGQVGSSKFTNEPAQHKGGQIVHLTTSDAATLNPILEHDTASGAIISLIFNGLMQADPSNAEPVGDLAKSWEISPDGSVYTFLLNDGVKWHDGQPCTAADVKFTYDLLLNPDSKSPRYSTVHERVKSVEAKDDSHVVVTLNAPNSAVLASNMGYGIMPQHVLKDVAPKSLAQDPFSTGKKGRTIGTGPFMFEEWIKDDHATVVKFPDYWRGEANLDKWIFKVVPNQTVETQQLKTGEADVSSIQPSDYDDMKKQSKINVHVYDTFSTTFYTYQMDPAKSKVFQDKEVRQALLYALDRAALVKTIDFSLSKIAVGTIPSISWAYNPDGIKLKYDHDADKAKQLLDQAGWKPGSDGIRAKNGQRLSFTLLTNSGSDVRQQYVTVFQQLWKEIGVEATPKFMEWNAFLTKISDEKDFDIFFEGYSWGVDPDQTTWYACNQYTGGANRAKYCNPQVDKLLGDALATTDHAKRKQIYTEFENIIMDELPYVVTDFPQSVVGVNKRVHNYFPNAINSTFNAEKWWVEG